MIPSKCVELHIYAALTLAIGIVVNAASVATAEDPVSQESSKRQTYLVKVSLPINDQSERAVLQTIQRYVERTSENHSPQDRPILVLEFDTSNARTGIGSDFSRCQSLARYLTKNELGRFHTVAYIPEPQGFVDASRNLGQQANSDLKGHAVLVALSCNEIIMHEKATIGDATVDAEQIDEEIEFAYRFYTAKRAALPVPVAMSMVDPQISLIRYTTEEKVDFVDSEQFEKISQSGKVIESETLSEKGALAVYDSASLLKWRLITHRVRNKRDLAIRLKVSPDQLISESTLGVQWEAALIDLSGGIDRRTIDWMIREVDRQRQSTDTNLFIVKLDFVGGDPHEALRLAQQFSEFDPNEVRTVAYIPESASGATAIVAMGCDQIMMGPDATIGGPVDPPLTPQQIEQLSVSLKELAKDKKRDWSVYVAMIDPKLQVVTWRHRTTGEIRLLSRAQHELLDDTDQWLELRKIETSEGIKADLAEQLSIASHLVSDFEQVKSIFRLSADPVVLEPTLAEQWIERVARELAAPWVAGWLLFGAMFFISTEFSQPGTGVPGFLGTVCLMLFFWSQYLEGNAQWLEILLFVIGASFIALELFVLPGFGIFGVGGLIMMVISIVLASQTFVWPKNEDEYAQLPISLLMVVSASLGVVVSFSLLRKYLPHMPVFKRLMLTPPTGDPTSFQELAERESIVRLEHLLNQKGQAITALRPGGKAKIAGQIVNVITDGRSVEKGEQIVVSEVYGNRVVVQLVEE
jgi:membrane-bound serine protease (ClpP class)